MVDGVTDVLEIVTGGLWPGGAQVRVGGCSFFFLVQVPRLVFLLIHLLSHPPTHLLMYLYIDEGAAGGWFRAPPALGGGGGGGGGGRV